MSVAKLDPRTLAAPVTGNGHHRVVDHVLHGLVTIRLIDPPESALRALRRVLGPSTGSAAAEPDITVTFVDRLPTVGTLRTIGLNDAAFDDAHFYRVDEFGHRTQIDFGALGEPGEILCERGVSVIPLLVPILGLRLLAKGYVLLHSGAFVYEGVGVLVTGWEKGGKTETLLPFMAAGAHYLSDEWTIVSPDDGLLYGLSGMTQVWSWHLRQLPEFWARIPAADRQRIRAMRLYQRMYRALPESVRGGGIAAGWLHRLSLEGGYPLLGQSRVAPELIFRDHLWQGSAPLDRLFLATVASGPTAVLPVEAAEIARRMAASLAYERRTLWIAYQQSLYAFPERRNMLLESASLRERELLLRLFAGRTAHEIRHSYPADLAEIYRMVRPYVVEDDR